MSRFREQFAARAHPRLAEHFGETGVTVRRLVAGEWSEPYEISLPLADRGASSGLFTAGERTPGVTMFIPFSAWPAALVEPRGQDKDHITIVDKTYRVREVRVAAEAADVWELTLVQ